jgi:hypothetical protein
VEWRRLPNEDLNYVCYPLNDIRVIKSKRMRWARHVARMERCAYRVFVRKHEGKRLFGRPRSRWGIILKLIFNTWEGGHGMD